MRLNDDDHVILTRMQSNEATGNYMLTVFYEKLHPQTLFLLKETAVDGAPGVSNDFILVSRQEALGIVSGVAAWLANTMETPK